MHVDVGGGKPSNFGIAIGHAVPFVVANKDVGTGYTKSHRIVIDLAYAVRPMPNGEMNFRLARELLDTLIDRFHITCYSSDGWNDLEYQQRIRHKVDKVETFTVGKEHYEELKYAIYDGRFRCHHYPLAEEELKRLGLKNGTKVIKGTGYTKDVADCLAAVTYRCRDKVIKRHAVGFATMGVLAR
jgi:hypothetical protein